jgi:hypothetical protein
VLFREIRALIKKNTAYVFPNAIEIVTDSEKVTNKPYSHLNSYFLGHSYFVTKPLQHYTAFGLYKQHPLRARESQVFHPTLTTTTQLLLYILPRKTRKRQKLTQTQTIPLKRHPLDPLTQPEPHLLKNQSQSPKLSQIPKLFNLNKTKKTKSMKFPSKMK